MAASLARCVLVLFLATLFMQYRVQYDDESPMEESDYVEECGPFLGAWDKKVYLATYPRSGNHWVRYLIEEVTHIATSSVYCDPDIGRSHLGKPFPWGGYSPKRGYMGTCRYPTPDDVVVIKTHFPAVPAAEFDKSSYLKTIRIVRHPVDSLYSFYAWEARNQAKSTMPKELLKKRINTWAKFHEYWNQQPNVLTIRYEDLLADPQGGLKAILEAMGYEASAEQIENAVQKHPPQGSPLKHLGHFENEDLDLIQRELGTLMKQFDYKVP
jgi:hypothetical protein